jgi:hypothetical protein
MFRPERTKTKYPRSGSVHTCNRSSIGAARNRGLIETSQMSLPAAISIRLNQQHRYWLSLLPEAIFINERFRGSSSLERVHDIFCD